MADTLEEILNQSYTVDSFTNNSLTLLSTNSSTRYVIKDIYVNTDNAAALKNLKLYSNGFLLGNFLYGGSGSEIIGTNGNLTLQSDGLTDYYSSAYDLEFSITGDNFWRSYRDIIIPYIGENIITESATSSVAVTATNIGNPGTNASFTIIPDLRSGATSYYIMTADFYNTWTLHGYQSDASTSSDFTMTTTERPMNTNPTLPGHIYYGQSNLLFGAAFNSTIDGTLQNTNINYPTNSPNESVNFSGNYGAMIPITDSTGNWNGGGFLYYLGDSRTRWNLVRFNNPTSVRSVHRIYNGSNVTYWKPVTNNTAQATIRAYNCGEFDTDNVNYFILCHINSATLVSFFKVYFTEVADGNWTDTIATGDSGYTIELIEEVVLTYSMKQYNSAKYMYKNKLFYIDDTDTIRSYNWKTKEYKAVISSSNFNFVNQSTVLVSPSIPSQSTMNSRGYNTRTSFDLRIAGIKSL